jgi:hypothetical protein
MEKHIRLAHFLAVLLDAKFNLFGVRFGLSAINVIPGIGDITDVLLSLYIVWIGIQIKLPSEKIARMLGNIVFSFFLGLIPIIGDFVYIWYKPNLRNLNILKTHPKSF